ncbi:MAG: hypothetical protein EOR76_25180 [Mesorhizobium sp.]|nr:MAG: hypothetical protein EOR49_24785 [Mesorhizobium sp.]RWM44461.1 MAG: hypothetical protein EOR76_25180 [Mesorhizobium sp.]
MRENGLGRGGTRKTMIVALACNLLIAFWRLVTTGEIPTGVAVRLVQSMEERSTGRALRFGSCNDVCR